jgi:hypothetical protein
LCCEDINYEVVHSASPPELPPMLCPDLILMWCYSRTYQVFASMLAVPASPCRRAALTELRRFDRFSMVSKNTP